MRPPSPGRTLTSKGFIGTAVGVILALSAWGGLTLVSHVSRISALEANQAYLSQWLARVEGKLDAALLQQGRDRNATYP